MLIMTKKNKKRQKQKKKTIFSPVLRDLLTL